MRCATGWTRAPAFAGNDRRRARGSQLWARRAEKSWVRPTWRIILAVATWLATGVAIAVMPIAPGEAWAEGKDLDGVINLNTAGEDLLELLPGIGPAKVRSILSYRQRRPFRTVDELVRIKGVGRKMVRHLRAHLAVSGPSTAHAVHRARDSEPSPPLPPPLTSPPRKPLNLNGVAAAPLRRPPVPAPPVRARAGDPRARAGERWRSAADHCARPP
jgi:competence ComEA-like helix-hairpin-helix protein